MKAVVYFDVYPLDLDFLRSAPAGITFVVCKDKAELHREIRDADILLTIGLRDDVLSSAPKLRWVASVVTGVDRFVSDPQLRERSIIVTNGSGVSTTSIAEHTIAMMLAFARGLPQLLFLQQKRQWSVKNLDLVNTFELSGQRVALFGLGNIGKAVAARAKAFGMTVWALKRRVDIAIEHVDRQFSSEDRDEFLAGADHLVIAAPLTSATRGAIDRDALSKLPDGAHLYNISRGELIDQEALIEALSEGRLAGAGLDVTTPEPLPPDSPLWDMPNVVITGHSSAVSPKLTANLKELLLDNFNRFLNGEPLRNRVDLVAGY